MLTICEIFTSIQGETAAVGKPCTFIRLAGCNLSCAWCDTVYARTEPGRPLAVLEIVKTVAARGIPLVCITGGEPLLQAETSLLAKQLCAGGFTVLVETNGSLDIAMIAPPARRIVDFKPPSSGESGAMDWDNIGRLREHDEIKFVLANREDYEWAREIIRKYNIHKKAEVLLGTVSGTGINHGGSISAAGREGMAPGTEVLTPAQLAGWILADKLEVRLQIQLHRVLWPGKTWGV